jgi:chromosome segregation ATPase
LVDHQAVAHVFPILSCSPQSAAEAKDGLKQVEMMADMAVAENVGLTNEAGELRAAAVKKDAEIEKLAGALATAKGECSALMEAVKVAVEEGEMVAESMSEIQEKCMHMSAEMGLLHETCTVLQVGLTPWRGD